MRGYRIESCQSAYDPIADVSHCAFGDLLKGEERLSMVRGGKTKRAKPGDVGRLQIGKNSWAELQYLGKHDLLGPAVLVNPNLKGNYSADLGEPELKRYVVFYLFPDFVQDGLVEVIDYRPPEYEVPLVTRQRQLVTRSLGPCKSWVIWDANGQKAISDDLSDEELDIPVRMILSHATLLHMLRNGWQPSDDVIRDKVS